MTIDRRRCFRLERAQKDASAAPDGKPKVFKFRANDGEFDRYQDRLSVSGWKLDAFNANPVILYNHDAGDGGMLGLGKKDVLPIGKGRAYVEGAALMVDIEFDQDDEFAKKVESKVEKGMLNAVSVRYLIPDQKYEQNAKGGYDSTEQELLEISIVTIPGNQRAVRVKGLNADEQDLVDAFASAVAKNLKQSSQDAPASTGAEMEAKELDALKAENARLKALAEQADAAKAMEAKKAEREALKAELKKEVVADIMDQAKGQRGSGIVVTQDELDKGRRTEKSVDLKKGQAFGQFCLAWIMSGGLEKSGANKGRMVEILKGFGSHDMAKSLQESVFAAGGSAVPVEFSTEFIELLFPKLVLMQMGANATTFKTEKVIGSENGGTVAYWIDEGSSIPESTPSTGTLKLKSRKLGVFSNVSNNILRNPAAGYDDVRLTNNMVRAAKIEFEKQAILAGLNTTYPGGTGKPTGILKQMDQSQSFAKAGTAIANYIADIDKLVLTVDNSNRDPEHRGFLLSPTLETTLLGLRDNAGWVFRTDMLERGMLRGKPYATTTQMPTTHLMFAEFADITVGMDVEAEITSTNALRFREDETSFKLIMSGDALLERAKSVACINNY